MFEYFGRNSGTTPWLPGQVIQLTGTRDFTIQLSDGQTVRRHMDHLRRRLATSQPIAEFDWDTSPPPSSPDVPIPPASPTPSREESPSQTTDRSSPPVRRYPARERRPPDQYTPESKP